MFRYVWEIVVAVHDIFVQEETMVTLNLEDGMTCDVIGDVHGTIYCRNSLPGQEILTC